MKNHTIIKKASRLAVLASVVCLGIWGAVAAYGQEAASGAESTEGEQTPFGVAPEDVTVFTRPDHLYTDLSGYSDNVFYDLPYAGSASTDSQKLHLVLPAEEDRREARLPVLVFVHGGDFVALNSSGHSISYTGESALWALKRGYAVAFADFTLAPVSGEYQAMPGAIYDIKAAIRYLRSVSDDYDLNPDKIAVMGEGSGAQLASLLGTTIGEEAYDYADFGSMAFKSDVQAVIAISGITDLSEEITERFPQIVGRISTEELGEDNGELLFFSDPIAHVDGNEPPFFIEAGLRDTQIPYSQSCDLYNAVIMRNTGSASELYLFPGMDNGVTWFQSEENAALYLDWLDNIFGREREADASVDTAGEAQELLKERMRPVWEGNVVYSETVWPVAGEDGAIADIPLLYEIQNIVEVTDFGHQTIYVEGRDYTLADGKLRILPEGSIPVTPYGTYYPAEGNASFQKEDGTYLYVDGQESLAMSGRQICVTYTHADTWAGEPVEGKAALLPRTNGRLNAGGRLTVVFYGDSIAEGYDASGTKPLSAGEAYLTASPYQPRFTDLLTAYLQESYPGADIRTYNTSLAGTDSAWGAQNAVEHAADYEPDLCVIVFGMNDGSEQVSAEAFAQNLLTIMDEVLEVNPECEFVLLSTSLPNPEAASLNGTHASFAPVMKELESEGVAVADMTALHASLMQNKRYQDMTGNNLNHPNDFLGRVYAQLLYATITGE